MARTITLYKVFIASPSDLHDERTLVAEIVDELNLSFSNTSNVKLELVKWETHANPGSGSYPQEVINKDVNDDYDIFIGLFWSKFGTATKNYGSGTEEEFSIAYEKYRKIPDSVKIMFYFKQAPIPFDKIDTESINAIRNFKSGLNEKGILYWDFNTIEEFQKLLRIQLTRKIQELQHSETKVMSIEKEQIEPIEEELGLLDYIELGEDSFKEVIEILERMTDAIEWIGSRFTERAEAINRQTSLNPEMGNKAKMRLVNSSASDLNSFNQRLKTEIPLFATAYKNGIDSYLNGIKISIELQSDSEDEIEETINSIDIFIGVIETSITNCEEFKKTIDELPRMTKEFNAAKRIGSGILFEMISEFETSVNLAKALKIEFEEYKLKY